MLPGVICDHVGSQGVAACLVVHDAPRDDKLTGWQVTCGADRHAPAELRVVDLEAYIERDRLQDLRELLQEGHRASRGAPGQPWLVEPLHVEDEAA
jgi:hypothetical protein